MFWLILGIIANSQLSSHWAWIVPPLVALSLNLIAALVTTRKLQKDPYLLTFHLALLIFIFIAGLNAMSARKGRVELTEGGEFSGQLDEVSYAPIQLAPLDPLRFKLLAMEINYQADGERMGSYARIQVSQPAELKQQYVIADQHPFVFNGNRFYITSNKGFALLLKWRSNKTKLEQLGSVHLPSYPAFALQQKLEWQPPNSMKKIWMLLKFDQDPIEKGESVKFHPPENPVLIVRGDRREQLLQGQSISLGEGELTFVGIRSWMGLRVQYDGLLSWLLASALLAVIALTGYFLRQNFSRYNMDV